MPMKTVKVNLSNIEKVTNPVFYPCYGITSRYLVFKGGAGSGKSTFCAHNVVLRSTLHKHHFVVFRKVAVTLKASVWAELRNAIEVLGLSEIWKENKTELTLTNRLNGSIIRCWGLDEPEKLKSIHGMTSAWLEEATDFTKADLNQINLRLRGQSQSYKQILISFNPINALHWLKAEFYDKENPPQRVHTHHSTFEDNIFIDEEYKQELRAYIDVDPYIWAVYGKGEWGIVGNLVYKPWKQIGVFPEIEDEFYGLDFGFNNPSALIHVGIRDNDLYGEELIYKSNLTNTDIIKEMKELKIPYLDEDERRLFREGYPVKYRPPIYCDSAEPARIEELFEAGFLAFPADKGPGSVGAGIQLVQSKKVYTYPHCMNFIAEQAGYKWREDKDGNKLDDPVKFNDHLMDAFRMGVFTHLRNRVPEDDYIDVDDLEEDLEDEMILPMNDF